MMRGTCIHRSLAHNYLPKIESREDLPVEDVLDHFSTNFDEEAHITAWMPDEDKGKVKDGGARVLEHYQEIVAPTTQPIDVERKFAVDLSWKDGEEPKQAVFKGVIDLVTEKKELVDHKSTKSTPKKPQGSHRQQLAGYVLGKEAVDGEKPNTARLDYLVMTKEPKIVTFEMPITDGQKKFLLSQIPKVVKQMEAGPGYYTANRGNIYCSETGCGYWKICHSEFGG